MSAIELLPGIHLVGSGNAGFDLTNPLDCHVYLIEGDFSWALIDAGSGSDSARIIDNIRETGVNLARPGHLFITHGHADHSGGAGDLADAFPTMNVWAGAPANEWIMNGDTDAISLDRGKASGVYPDSYLFRSCREVGMVADTASFDLGGCAIEAVYSPGHADGHVSYLLHARDGRRVLFSGDCVFTRGRVSLQNLHDVSIPAYAHTMARLTKLKADVLLPGHYSLSLSNAARHIARAHEAFVAGSVPPNAP
jgi:hydroxyacylglutathione hydrolase